jgi:hypothetical protein
MVEQLLRKSRVLEMKSFDGHNYFGRLGSCKFNF